MKKFWPLGFLGILGFYGVYALQHGNWLAAMLTFCFGFFVFFLPDASKRKQHGS